MLLPSWCRESDRARLERGEVAAPDVVGEIRFVRDGYLRKIVVSFRTVPYRW